MFFNEKKMMITYSFMDKISIRYIFLWFNSKKVYAFLWFESLLVFYITYAVYKILVN